MFSVRGRVALLESVVISRTDVLFSDSLIDYLSETLTLITKEKQLLLFKRQGGF